MADKQIIKCFCWIFHIYLKERIVEIMYTKGPLILTPKIESLARCTQMPNLSSFSKKTVLKNDHYHTPGVQIPHTEQIFASYSLSFSLGIIILSFG